MFFYMYTESNARAVKFTIDKRNQKLKFEICDVKKQLKTDIKVVGLNIITSLAFFINNIVKLLIS
jgi:hypothetical protein